jgi:hypothetical protein|tara:strand:- start:395 stop:835 length:441 start_codon:yes stop_codon:yes gene_type:complete
MNVNNKPGPLRAQVVEVLGEDIFPKLASQCASVNCEARQDAPLPFDAEGFCEECSMGMKWHDLRQVRESHGLMTSKSTGTLSVAHQEAIIFARENRAEIIKAAEAEAAPSRYWRGVSLRENGCEISARGGLDFEQHLEVMEARHDR